MARSRVLRISGLQLLGLLVATAVLLLFMALGLYHWVFLKGARDGWPVIGDVVRFVIRDEFASRDLYMRQNLDVMARQLGEMQVKLTQIESLGERVSGLAGVPATELKKVPGSGGLQVASRSFDYEELQALMSAFQKTALEREGQLTALESKLFERKLESLMIPTQRPLPGTEVGSRFGWRVDPFTGRSALHTGLDFPADTGTPIVAAAGGLVIAETRDPEYGNVVEIDHGNDVTTRYAHASKILVKKGDLVKRGQVIALVGTTGRSTGPHLHFEVMVRNVWQDPQKFLTVGDRQEIKSLPAIMASKPDKRKAGPAVNR